MSKSIYRILLIVVIVLTGISSCIGQSVKVIVSDNEKNALAGVTVHLINVSDSAETYSITDQNGTAAFDGLGNAIYSIKISYIGFQTIDKKIMVKADQRTFYFNMKEGVIALDDVDVVAKRPLIRQEDDKMIIDPEPIVSTSANTLDVLESTPGLFVDQDGGIYLSSLSPAKIYINGREQKMSNQDIMTILRILPPGSVQRIEIMRTPSTKYDAASSGGIINIILKKGVKIGRFGSVNGGFRQGSYGNRFAGISVNNSGEKSTQYLNMNYSYNDMLEEMNTTRYLGNDTFVTQSSGSRQQSTQAYIGYGLNYDVAEKLNISYDGRLNASLPESNSLSKNDIQTVDELLLSASDNIIKSESEFLSVQQDMGALFKIDSIGSEWDTKFSFSYNYNNNIQEYQNQFNYPVELLLEGDGENNQTRYFLIFQSDLTQYLKSEIKIETGIKSSIQDYTSEAAYFSYYNGDKINDVLRSNAFSYSERISAGYAQASKTIPGNIILKTGVRLEYTYMNGRQAIPTDTSFLVNRADWFPYVYLSKGFRVLFGIELRAFLIYRRTIDRPGYQELNPYVKVIDPLLYETGNPSLTPQFTDNIEMNISYEEFPVFALGKNYTTDIFSEVIYSDEKYPGAAIRTYDNIGKSNETYLRGMIGIPPGGKYFFALGSQYNLNEYDGFYENEPLSYRRGSWRFFTFHSLTLFKQTKITVSGFMMVNGQRGFIELGNFGQLNMGINQSLMKNKLNITFSGRDILRTMVMEFNINQGSVNTFGDRYTDNRRFGINIRYNFGIPKKRERQGFPGFESAE